MRKDKNFKSRPGVYNIQQKDSIKKKKLRKMEEIKIKEIIH